MRDPTVGSLDTDLLSRYSSPVGGMAPTVYHRRLVPIPRISMENRLQKHVKKFECDPSVGSLDTDMLRRYSDPFGGAVNGRSHAERRQWEVLTRLASEFCTPSFRSANRMG